MKSSRPGFPEGGPPDKPQNRPVRLRKQEQGIHTDPQENAEQEREAQRRKGTKVSPAGREKIKLGVEKEKGNVSQRQ